ncbi:capsular biosynthesis protein [Anaerobacillus alkaliphilus]|uniref:Capsular biosynthesis protein n=1 Tax=Anaerobacillus alkaliphilus TaxID=1548597 RepID=A0A4Q0VV18_9BACI|nr:Wzz/FepE/Etk N-terminal domain-containing protein [Anaerobacillus alkaliphilus]RXJ02264.1 capsular biosynthesis protein [Anaerobacillus alkaliphilus]
MEETISLKELFETLRKRIALIISITILAVGISAIMSYFVITPKYQASTQILVSQAAAGSISSLLSGGNPFDSDSKYIETYNVIMKSPYILNQVKEEIGIDRNIATQLTVSQEGRSQVVKITVQDTNPVLATEIANVTAEVFQREIQYLLKVDNIHILSRAELSAVPTPISPKPNLNMAIAFVVGLMTSVGLAFLLEFLNNTVRTEEDIEKLLGLPVLGAIPVIDEEHINEHGYGQSEKVEKGSGKIGA